MGCRQGIFKRGDKHVAVRPVKLTSTVTIQPGESVDSIRGFQKRRLFKIRRIGIAGSKWANEMILACGDPAMVKLRPEISNIESLVKSEEVSAPPVPPSAQASIEVKKAEKKSKKS